MIKDILNNTIRAGLAEISLQDLKDPVPNSKPVQLTFTDYINCKKLSDRLRIECTREFSFDPECNFKLKITYFVEHFLKIPNTLDPFTDESIEKEITSNLEFYLQSNQGFAARLSLLAAQITSTFGGSPAITPPIFPISQEKKDD